MAQQNIILIGMAGAGKTTIGKRLAEKMGMVFCDTDDLICKYANVSPRELIKAGKQYFMHTQRQAILGRNYINCVIATGGSVVCDEHVMSALTDFGLVIYIKTDIDVIETRVDKSRELVRDAGQGVKQLFLEREELYINYADIIIEADGKAAEDLMSEIEQVVGRQGG